MDLLTDLRHALRRLLAAPSFTAVAVLTLALGIGSTSAIYSVIDALMLRPLPYADPQRLVDLGTATERGGILAYFDPTEIPDLQAKTDLFASLDGWTFASGTLAGGGEPSVAFGAALGGNVMRTLGVSARLGRVIDESDTRGGQPVIVLSDASWRKRFGADPGIVGRKIRRDNETLEVIGVMPPAFAFPDGRREFWVPLTATVDGRAPSLQVVARLRSDLTLAGARARIEASALPPRSAQEGAVPRALRVLPPLAGKVNPPVRTALYLLAGAVGFVLLIACANIANLLFVQHAAREREVAVRTALGASRARLARQFLTEVMVLAAVGGLLGLIVAQWAIALLQATAPPQMTFLSVHSIGLDGRVLLFSLLLTLLTGALCGSVPAWRSARAMPHHALKAGGRGATDGPGHERLRRAFVVLQLAVSVVLLVGAALLARTFLHLTQVDPGFESDHLALTTLELPRWRYPTAEAREAFLATLSQRLRALPGVVDVTRSGGAPPDGGNLDLAPTFEIEGRGVVLDDPKLVVPNSSVSPEYFAVMGIPMIAGRSFSADDTSGAPAAIIISQTMASRLWPGTNAVGQRLKLRQNSNAPWYTVVGIVQDVYQLDYAQTRGQFAYYFPATQRGLGAVQTIALRTAGDPAFVLPLVRDQVRALDPEQSIWKLDTAPTAYARFFALPRFYTSLMAALAGLGIVIAAVGLYGVLTYAIAQQTREFGIRLALGAQKRDILRMVLRGGAVVTGLGLLAGALGSVFVTRSLESMLVDVPRLDPIAYGVVAIVLALVALAACWIPASRATRVDPVVALRAD
jgi:predicted permease